MDSQASSQQSCKANSVVTACTIPRATSAMPNAKEATELNLHERRSLRSSASAMIQRVADACSSCDQRKLITSYFVVVYVCRLLMRLPCAQDIPWPVVMLLEDGLSMMSFVLGMLYLNSSNGAPLRFLVKCFIPSSPDASAVEAETEEESLASAVSTNERPLRLFYFAI